MSDLINNIKLIASDIDGTLLLNSTKQVSDELFLQIRRLKKDKGILFMAASGRQYQNLQVLFRPVKDEIIYLCENGCLGVYQNQIIYQKELERELAFKIAESILAEENCEVQISTPDTQYIMPKTEAFYQYMKNEAGIKVRKIKNIRAIKEPILKVAVYNPCSMAHRDRLQKLYGHKCAIHLGRSDWTDFTPLKTDKGTALKAIIKTLRIKPKECMAFGDYYNDESMLKAVGFPIVMNTAPLDLQKIGKETTDTVEHAIERIYF
jgi:Cof subfamily protein (haloacid dehalogenase superfamily)